MTKLYLVEWDAWSLEGICKTRTKAESCIRSYVETIKEIEVPGKITNNEVFIIIDGTGDYRGIHSNKEDAQLELDGYYKKGNFCVKPIKLID